MKPMRIFAASLALMCGTSALAQTTAPDSSMPQSTAPDSTAPQSTMPDATTPQGTTSQGTMSQGATSQGTMAQPSTDMGTQAQAGTQSTAVAGGQFAAFDANSDNALSPLEFAQYLGSQRAPAAGDSSLKQAKKDLRSKRANNSAVQLLNDTALEFSQADQNRDMRVTQDELAMLSGMTSGASASPWQSGTTGSTDSMGTGTGTGAPTMPASPAMPDTSTMPRPDASDTIPSQQP